MSEDRATNAHQADHQRLESITAQLPAAIWTTDRQLCFTNSLGGVLPRLNLQSNQVVGKTLYEFFQTEERSLSGNCRTPSRLAR